MIPETSGLIETEIILEEPSSRTFFINFDEGRLGFDFDGEGGSSVFIDDLKAMRQTVFCILNTERYEHLIYSWDYGSEMRDLTGMDEDIVLSEIERRITVALLEDSRIISVGDFEFEEDKKQTSCAFRVSTIYGDLVMEQEVDV